jgi:hypothetical protein
VGTFCLHLEEGRVREADCAGRQRDADTGGMTGRLDKLERAALDDQLRVLLAELE